MTLTDRHYRIAVHETREEFKLDPVQHEQLAVIADSPEEFALLVRKYHNKFGEVNEAWDQEKIQQYAEAVFAKLEYMQNLK